jgi:hypothetical protein
MLLGLAMQGVGLAVVAVIASPDVDYLELGIALTIAGVGTSLCFPTVANAVMGSVRPSEAGVASGTNSTMRELGGVFGVAVLAAVFSHQGGYESAQAFTDGFRPALLLGAGLSAIGAVAAMLAPGTAAEPSSAVAAVPYTPEYNMAPEFD